MEEKSCAFKVVSRRCSEGSPFRGCTITKTNSVALVRKLTIPTERPPLVGEVSAKLSG
jgi:hypothetical protein